jgi:sterol desaturase/sphingolipid hydroxylase (fatty acid hydroxylase superfamily)
VLTVPPLDKNYELLIRFGFFIGILIIMAFWEYFAPRRPLITSKAMRWASNLGLVLIDSVSVRLVFPTALAGMALLSQEKGWGLLNYLELPYLLDLCLGVLILDFAIYLQHIMFHAIPVFWRLHMVHHSDMDYDVTTGVRFHPIEIILSMGIKMAVVLLIGPLPLAIPIFEILLNGTSMFNHGNVRYPLGIDKWLRLLVVTPEMHRVHHSNIRWETNCNFGFNFPWWDRLFGTYRPQPAKGHLGMTIGLDQYKDPKKLTFLWLIALPFIGKMGRYPLTPKSGAE